MTAPVQVLVVGFDRPSFSGEVLVELARLREAGIVRLVDLLLVTRAEDGTFQTLDLPTDAGVAGLGELAAELLGSPEVAGSGPLQGEGWSLADAVPAGSTAAVALLEHLWAGPLSEAIGRAGGVPLEEAWLAPEDREVLDALIARRAAGSVEARSDEGG
ncbi:MAG TPA: DUF6325 family protein [Actinomycetes bacterium]|nr:DUF6325 family protein [Actinomycetes bacterium]